jgi:hypothetical protein
VLTIRKRKLVTTVRGSKTPWVLVSISKEGREGEKAAVLEEVEIEERSSKLLVDSLLNRKSLN